MKKLKKNIIICLSSLLLFISCGSDDNTLFRLLGAYVMISIILNEEGEASVDVTPDCEQQLIFTEDTYQEKIQQGLNCEQEIVSEILNYELSGSRLIVRDQNGDVMHNFGFEEVNSDTFKLTTDSVNGNDLFGLIATYKLQ